MVSLPLPLLILLILLISHLTIISTSTTPSLNQSIKNYKMLTTLSLRGGVSRSPTKSNKKSATLQSLNSPTATKKTRNAKTATGKFSLANQSNMNTKTAVNDAMEKYNKILPLTRKFMTLALVSCVLSLVGGEAGQELMAFDMSKIVKGGGDARNSLTTTKLTLTRLTRSGAGQFWRIIFGSTFLGGPSIKLIMDFYYIYQHGSLLESSIGSSTYLLFLFTQVCLLGLLATTVFPTPFFGQSMIAAMLHVVSRVEPHKPTKWIVFNIPSWMLPFAFMVGDVLQAQSPGAAVPHIMGILTGHMWVFLKTVNVKMGGEDFLVVPEIVRDKFALDELLESGVANKKKNEKMTMSKIREMRRRKRNQ